jgi:carbon monoxide dehydrogenase subunit G
MANTFLMAIIRRIKNKSITMKTTIEKEFQLDQPIATVWEYLSDPTKIVGCVPGASITEKIDDKNYKGQVTTSFGPVKASYNGEVTITELDATNHKMVLSGKGVDSKGKGSADMTMNGTLTEKDGATSVKFIMDISIMGMLAQFGARLIKDVSDQLLNQFVNNFKSLLAGQKVDNTMKGGSMVGTVLKSAVGGIFKGGDKK